MKNKKTKFKKTEVVYAKDRNQDPDKLNWVEPYTQISAVVLNLKID